MMLKKYWIKIKDMIAKINESLGLQIEYNKLSKDKG